MDLTYLLNPLKLQIPVYEKVLRHRNTHSNLAFHTKISTILEDISYDKTPMDLVIHGISALHINLRKLQTRDVRTPGLTESHKFETADDLIDTLRYIHILAEELLANIDLENLPEPVQHLNGNLTKFVERYTRLITHCIHHIGQALLFQGLICQYLQHR